jgi:hypothetical protein
MATMDALRLIKQDHEEIKKMMDELSGRFSASRSSRI